VTGRLAISDDERDLYAEWHGTYHVSRHTVLAGGDLWLAYRLDGDGPLLAAADIPALAVKIRSDREDHLAAAGGAA
jgi:hypothetical protein